MEKASAEEGRKIVDRYRNKYLVLMFGRSNCPACVSARTNLTKQLEFYKVPANQVKFIYLEQVGRVQYSISTFLQLSTGRNASPFIYLRGDFIGNNVDLRNLIVEKKFLSAIRPPSPPPSVDEAQQSVVALSEV